MRKREEILADLIHYRKALGILHDELSAFDWDIDTPLVKITSVEVKEVLYKYLDEKISDEELEDWANAIEMRDDIEFDSEDIRKVVFDVANPILTEPSNKQRIENYIIRLNT